MLCTCGRFLTDPDHFLQNEKHLEKAEYPKSTTGVYAISDSIEHKKKIKEKEKIPT